MISFGFKHILHYIDNMLNKVGFVLVHYNLDEDWKVQLLLNYAPYFGMVSNSDFCSNNGSKYYYKLKSPIQFEGHIHHMHCVSLGSKFIELNFHLENINNNRLLWLYFSGFLQLNLVQIPTCPCWSKNRSAMVRICSNSIGYKHGDISGPTPSLIWRCIRAPNLSFEP